MSHLNRTLFFIALFFSAVSSSTAAENSHGQKEHIEIAAKKGAHGGRLLTQGDITVELAIAEQGIPPEFRAWISRSGEPLVKDSQAAFTVRLTRLGGQSTLVNFEYQGEYWLGNGVVEEPHSFDVDATVELDGKQHHWTWQSHEGRTRIEQEIAQRAGIISAVAGPGQIEKTATLYGRLATGSENLSHIRARFPGQITEVTVNIGDRVEKGDLLARIESTESLRIYALYAPIAGVITARHANTGELALDQPLFSITNLARPWAELKIFPRQLNQIAVGQALTVSSAGHQQQTRIEQIIPSVDEPFSIARAPVDNSEQSLWQPGLMVEAQVIIETAEAPLVVDKRALQPFRDWTVVFIQIGDEYEIRPLELGLMDDHFIEVLGGLQPGDRYVVDNSYLIKADIEKSGASHDH